MQGQVMLIEEKYCVGGNHNQQRVVCKLVGLGYFGLETRVIIKISIHPCYPKPLTAFHGIKQKKSRWPVNFQYFFVKLSRMGPWVSRIDWCKGQQCGLMYMAVRLSDISPKTGKNSIFCVFRPFLSLCRTASRPYRMSHIAALCINQSY